ncbi:MAG: hypothetical protein ACLS48_00470 [[Eubacterium] siraeum]
MHLALYRKYRSATFDEVISQEHITTTLKNQIKVTLRLTLICSQDREVRVRPPVQS